MTWAADMERDHLRRLRSYATATRVAHHANKDDFEMYVEQLKRESW